MIKRPPEELKHGKNELVFAFLAGKSAHSDTASELWKACRDLSDVNFYCADRNDFGYVVACVADQAFAFAEGMQGVTLKLREDMQAQALSKGAKRHEGAGSGWVFFELFGSKGFEKELAYWVSNAHSYAQQVLNESRPPNAL